MTPLERAAALGAEALTQIFARYGRPLAIDAPLDTQVTVDVLVLGMLAYRSPVDVIANDWFVLVSDTRSAIPAPLFTALVNQLTARLTDR